MEDHFDLLKQKSDYKAQRSDQYKVDSRDRLSKILRKKIETTMIGALSSIENSKEESELTEDQVFMKDLYQKIRSEILDKGNTQARNVDAELAQYDVKWLKYSIKIPVITKEEED
jgi:hypothetical protein